MMPAAHARASALLLAAALLVSLSPGCGDPGEGSSSGPDPGDTASFVRAEGGELLGPDGAPWKPRGINFSNWFWMDTREEFLTSGHHDSTAFAEVAGWGMNTVRFAFSHVVLEDEASPSGFSEAGFAWLEENVRWAGQAGIRLILDMHVPPGGGHYPPGAPRPVLWDDAALQQRFVDLWGEIAARFAGEPAVAAYDLMNEPVVTTSPDQWRSLAEGAVAAIRAVDPDHMIVCAQPLYIWDTGETGPSIWITLSDGNVLYDQHFYHPFEYTHQLQDWIPTGEGGAYPEPDSLYLAHDIVFVDQYAKTEALPEGDTDWQVRRVEGPVNNSAGQYAGLPRMLVWNGVEGTTARFDDFGIRRVSTADTTRWRVRVDTAQTWYPWAVGPGPRFSFSPDDPPGGEGGSLQIRGAADVAAVWGREGPIIPIGFGDVCSIEGWIKGIAVAPGAECAFVLELWGSPSGPAALGRTRALLEDRMAEWVAWGLERGVPVYYGEYGAARPCYEDGRGGLDWTGDMISLFEQKDLGHLYWAYHEESFGVYGGTEDGLPDPARRNDNLVQLFRSHYGAR